MPAAVREALDDPNSRVRRLVILSLPTSGRAAESVAVELAVPDRFEDPHERAAALRILGIARPSAPLDGGMMGYGIRERPQIALDAVTAALEAKDALVVEAALGALGQFDERYAAGEGAVTRLLGAEDPALRQAALDGLCSAAIDGYRPHGDAREALVAALRACTEDPGLWTAMSAVTALRYLEEGSGVPHDTLHARIAGDDPVVAYRAFLALDLAEDAVRGYPALHAALRSSDGSLRHDARTALRQDVEPARVFVASLVPGLEAPDPAERQQTVELLVKMDPTHAEIEPLLVALLDDPDRTVRYTAAGFLSGLAPEHPARPRVDAVLADDPQRTHERLEALLRTGVPTDELRPFLTDSSWDVRASAFRLLANVADPEAAGHWIRKGLEDPALSVRSACLEVLRRTNTASQFVRPLFALAATEVYGLYLLADAGARTVIPETLWLPLLAHPARNRAFLGAHLAGQQRSAAARAVPALVRLLARPEPDLQVTVCRALEAYGADARAAVPALLTACRDPAYAVRGAALIALRAIDPGAPEVCAAFAWGLEDGCAEVRGHAVRGVETAARASSGSALVDALLPLLGDPSARVRARTAEALAAFGPRARSALGPLAARARDEPDEDARAAAAAAVERIRR